MIERLREWVYEWVYRPLVVCTSAPCPACRDDDPLYEGPLKDFRDCDCQEGEVARSNYHEEPTP